MPFLAGTFDVTIVDCGHWVRVGMANLRYQPYEFPNLVTVTSKLEFESVIKAFRPEYAIDFIGKGACTRTIQNILRQAGTKYVAHRVAPSPAPRRLLGSPSALPARLLGLARRAHGWLLRAMRNDNALPPDVALLAGSEASDYWTSSARTILWTGSFDYFSLSKLRRKRNGGGDQPRLHDGRFVLFIDDCLSLSMDFPISGRPRPIEPAEYFALLLRTFDHIERSLSIPVVVAAHPDGREVPGYASLFGGRAVLFGVTAELALDCELALTHYSTAVSYPVLLRKPIVALTTERVKHTYQGDAIDNLGRLLRCPVLSMEASAARCDEVLRSAVVDAEAYEKYEKSYVTTIPSDDSNPFEPFVRFATAS